MPVQLYRVRFVTEGAALCVVWPHQIRPWPSCHDYVKSFDWLVLSSTFCTSVVPHSRSGISVEFGTSGQGNSFLVLCTPVARARSIHCCKKHGVSKAKSTATATMQYVYGVGD